MQDKAVQIGYLSTGYIDFMRRVKSQESDEISLTNFGRNWRFADTPLVFKGFISLISLVSGFLMLLTKANTTFIEHLPGLILILFGLCFGRELLDWLLNHKLALIDPQKIYLSSRPFPMVDLHGKMVNHRQFKQFYVRKQEGKDRFFGSYALIGIDRDNHHFKIAVGSDTYCLILEKELENYLNLRDIPIGGSMDNPFRA